MQPGNGDIPFEPDILVRDHSTGEEIEGYRLPKDAPITRRYIYEVEVLTRERGTSDVSTILVAVQTDDLITYGAAIDMALEGPHEEHPRTVLLGGLVVGVYEQRP